MIWFEELQNRKEKFLEFSVDTRKLFPKNERRDKEQF